MKILQVIHSLDPRAGGTTEGLRQLSTSLVLLGAEVEVVCLDSPDSSWIADFPLPLIALGPGRGTYGYTAKLLPWLRKQARNYNLIVVNGLWQFGGFAVRKASRETGIPYVVFPHGMLDPWFKHHYPLKHLKKWLYWPWGEYRVLRDAAAVYFTSEDERREARKSFWLYQCREKVSSLGIEAPPFDAEAARKIFLAKFPHLTGKRLLLFLGRMHVKKGCDLLLRAFHRSISSSDVAPDLHLVMAGPHDNAYGQEMLQLSQSFKLDSRITWTGMLAGGEKWGALAAAEAFALPSHQENFGVSVVEALASGRPVLISNKVNIWREIVDARAGFADEDNQAGAQQLLDRWLSLDFAQREAMHNAARKCFQNHFQIQGVAERLLIELQRVAKDAEIKRVI